jgi:hypothetical protein
MNKIALFVLLSPLLIWGQSYAPSAGQAGTTAIHKDSSVFVAWATGIEVHRGYLDISNKDYEINGSNRASFGDPNFALGPATGNVGNTVSLGDSGFAVVTFDKPIINGPGWDFAIFENSFSDNFLEFAHVEVSSDGAHFVRFPSHSEVQTMTQTNGFGSTDTRYIDNLAGKYRVGFGTPFDLEDVADSIGIDLNNITHVKIIDVVGSIGPDGTRDSYGNLINDPFPTPFESGGFDLEAVGVIHQLLNTDDMEDVLVISIYPNPFSEQTSVRSNSLIKKYLLYDVSGRIVENRETHSTQLNLSLGHLQKGIYLIRLKLENGNVLERKVVKR